MRDALTGPFLASALVLAAAGLSKLRSPAPAARAAATLGVPAGTAAVRALALGELVLCCVCVAVPGRIPAGVLAATYAAFAGLSLMLVRRRQSCGCFGESDSPPSAIQPVLSAILALIALVAAAIGAPHGLGWVLGRSFGPAAVFVIGITALAYGTVLAYSELPRAWDSWTVR